MKRLIILFALCIYILSVSAQTTVKGTLADSLTHAGEPYATIRIYKEGDDAKPAYMAVTDAEGSFAQEIKADGNYTIVFSSVGHNSVRRSFNISGQKEVDLGTVLTGDDTATLGAVEVVAQKPIVKMEADKMTYSVADDSDSKTMTVLDILRKVPMVTVDGQDNISVNGSSAFKIYVDGKPNPMFSKNASQIFKAMPASMVSSIEVITNPGAKYDAEGAGGILDIKMASSQSRGASQEQMNGYNGSLTAQAGNRQQGLTAFVAGQQGKFRYNADVSGNYIDNGNVSVDMFRKQNDGSMMNMSTTSKNKVKSLWGQFSVGYDIDPLSSVNASFGLSKFSVTNNSYPTTRFSNGVYGKGFEYKSFSKDNFNYLSANASVDYQRFFNADHSSSLTITYQFNNNPGDNDNETQMFTEGITQSIVDLTSRTSYGHTNTIDHTAQLDLVNKLSEHQTLNSGLKYSNRTGTSDSKFYRAGKYEDALSTDYSNRDQIGAVYAELDNHWTTISAKVGLRYEQTWQSVEFRKGHGSNFNKNYGNLVPSVTLSKTLGMGKSIGATYNMRISRPGITYLNPYVDRSRTAAITYGNTALTVEKSHNFGLVYNYYSPKLMMNANLKQTFTNGGIEQYSFFDGNTLNTTYGNIVDRRITSLNIFASWSMTNTTRVTFNGGASYHYLRSKTLDMKNDGLQTNGMLSVQQTLPKKWTASLILIANAKTYTLQGYNSGFNIGVVSLSKSLLNNKLSVSVNGITGLSKGGKIHIDQHATGKDFTTTTNISVPLTRITATITWKFGNTKKQFRKHESKVGNDYIEKKNANESIGTAGGRM